MESFFASIMLGFTSYNLRARFYVLHISVVQVTAYRQSFPFLNFLKSAPDFLQKSLELSCWMGYSS